MTEEETREWQRRLEDTFAGPSDTIGERTLYLRDREAAIGTCLISRFKGYVVLMDSFLDFYIETPQHAVGVSNTQRPEVGPAIVAILVPTLWRFRPSYLLFWNGYFIDAISLLRAVLENAPVIAGLQRGIIDVGDVFGKLTPNASSEDLSDQEIHRLIRKYTRECDRKLTDHFIGSKSRLAPSSVQSLGSMLRVLNNAVHKSKLNVLLLYGPSVRGERPIPVFPQYDEDLASIYMNISQSLGWMFVRVLSSLKVLGGSFFNQWQKKDQSLMTPSDKLLLQLRNRWDAPSRNS